MGLDVAMVAVEEDVELDAEEPILAEPGGQFARTTRVIATLTAAAALR